MKVRKRTLVNLSRWPKAKIEALRRLLRDEPMVSRDDVCDIVRSLPHGHVAGMLGTLKRLGLETLIERRRSPERDRVVAMITSRVLDPGSKLSCARGLADATACDNLAVELGLEESDENDLYAAMDWLLERQWRIVEGCLVLYDLTSVWLEEHACPLSRRGHSRDGKKGKLQITLGLLCNARDVRWRWRCSPATPQTRRPWAHRLRLIRVHGLEPSGW